MEGPVILSREIERFAAEVQSLTPTTCGPTLEAYFTRLEGLDPAAVDLGDVRAHGVPTAHQAFSAALAVHRHLQTFAVEGTLEASCLQGIRRHDLATRYLIDHLVEVLPPGERPPEWLVNPSFSFADPLRDLRSGDVLVTRAELISSAGIAHMGRLDSQFSHNALVRVDPESGDVWVVEAYLESGGIVEPLARFLEHGLGRVVVLRPRDPALGARAAEAAFARIRHGKRIPYDAAFDASDPTALFCSEVPGWAYGPLLGLPLTIPRSPTVFEKAKNAALYAAMGISVDITSAPADILFDPTFDVVAEWRDATAIGILRRHDAVVESAMHWMEDEGYVLTVGPGERLTVGIGKFVRAIPLVGLSLRKKLSPGLDADFLATSLALQNGAAALDAALVDQLATRQSGEILTYGELRRGLEQLRVADLAIWTSDPDDATFHRWLHPSP